MGVVFEANSSGPVSRRGPGFLSVGRARPRLECSAEGVERDRLRAFDRLRGARRAANSGGKESRIPDAVGQM